MMGNESVHLMGPGQAIGVFDSGLGGLTVLQEIIHRLPNEHTIYFGDSGRSPYGSKSRETVIRYALQNTRFLLEQGVKMIVIACNTASAHAFDEVRRMAGVPVIEVVTPGAEAAVNLSRTRRIGVIGTRGTVDSQVYVQALQQATEQSLAIYQQACPLFVGLAEEGWWNNEIVRRIAEVYLEPIKAREIDTLVMGCTHYPLLSEVIGSVMGPTVGLINAGSSVAAKVAEQLAAAGLLNDGLQPAWHHYYSSDSAEHFRRLGNLFLASPIEKATHIEIEKY